MSLRLRTAEDFERLGTTLLTASIIESPLFVGAIVGTGLGPGPARGPLHSAALALFGCFILGYLSALTVLGFAKHLAALVGLSRNTIRAVSWALTILFAGGILVWLVMRVIHRRAR